MRTSTEVNSAAFIVYPASSTSQVYVLGTPRQRELAPDPGFFALRRGQAMMLGTCKAVGAIGVATALALQAELYDTIDNSDAVLVVVDCSDVTHMDPAGYRLLVDATDYAVRRGHALVIRSLSAECTSWLRKYDTERELRVEP